MSVWDWDSGAPSMDLDKRVVKLLYSPLAIFSEILAGKRAKVGWRSDRVGSNVCTSDR